MNFASDNTAPVAPAILDAIVAANRGYALGYGNDDWTPRVERRYRRFSSARSRCFWCRPARRRTRWRWRRSRRHGVSCSVTRIPTSPPTNAARRSFSAAGSSSTVCPATAARSAARHCKTALAGYGGHSPHQMIAAGALDHAGERSRHHLSHRRDRGALRIAHARSLAVHMDGARFANALVRLNATPAQMTWQSGIDVLSFGATKGGALAAEAVVIFDPARAGVLWRTAQARRPSPVQAPLHRRADFRPISPMTAGSSSHATPMPWPTGWRKS